MNNATNNAIRNIAIIAHVDHGKTSLVDQLFKQSGLFNKFRQLRDQERVMDNIDLERERGITIAAKNCAISYNGVKINIIDTPGHADFGGEVERALKMADGAILLVDASEGPLPQTRFVLQKALELSLKIVVVINKIDRSDARITEVLNEIFDLFIDLGASEEQMEFPVLYAVGRDGIAKRTPDGMEQDLQVLFDAILLNIPAPSHNTEEPFQMLVCNIGYSDYTGRLAVGKVFHGGVKKNDQLVCLGENHLVTPLKVTKLQVYDGVSLKDVTQIDPGDIIVLSGVGDVKIGDTICQADQIKALPRVTVDEPTVSMRFMGNSSPFSGQDGEWVQSQRVYDRLKKESLYNVAIQIEEDSNGECLIVKGRGEFQLAIVIETMRREGYEMCVGRPQIIYKYEDGVKKEPIEHLVVDCNTEYTGAVTEKLAVRKGRMVNMHPFGAGRVRLEFSVPTRGLIGYRNEFLTDTRGTGIMSAYLDDYEPYRGDIPQRTTGSLIADRNGRAVPYALFGLEDRGIFFVTPNTAVYEGMVVGEHSKDNDLIVNVCREKKMTNIRAAGRDENVILTPIVPLTLEQALDFIKDDEWVEVTPKNVRMRKAILDFHKRKVASKSGSSQESGN